MKSNLIAVNAVKEGCNTCQRKNCNGFVLKSCPGHIEKNKKFTLLELALKNSLKEVSILLDRAGLVFSPNNKGYGFQLIKK